MMKISTAGPQPASERLRAIMTEVSERCCAASEAIQAVHDDPTLLMALRDHGGANQMANIAGVRCHTDAGT